MKKITVGMFCDSFFPFVDGVNMVIDNYAKRLLKYANVVVIVPEMPGQKHDDSVYPYKVIRCKSFKLLFTEYSCPTPKITIDFKRQIDACKLDIVHIHSPFVMGNYAIEYAKKHHLPVVSTMHSQYDQDFMRLVKSKNMTEEMIKQMVKVFNKSNECWTVNNEMARVLNEEYKCKNKAIIINNATEMLPLKDVNNTNKEINKLYNLKSNEKLLLFVGRINRQKNLFFIVDALGILKNEKLNFKMMFVGSGPDEHILKNYIKESNLEKDAIMAGKIMDRELLSKIYARADLFIFPSLYDTNSLVQIEAASQRTPTAFIKSVTSSTTTNMVNSIVTNNNVVEYADAIIKVLKDKKLYETLSNNAYRDLYKHWDDLVKEIYDRYINLIENNK